MNEEAARKWVGQRLSDIRDAVSQEQDRQALGLVERGAFRRNLLGTGIERDVIEDIELRSGDIRDALLRGDRERATKAIDDFAEWWY